MNNALTLHASTQDHDRWDGPKRYLRIKVYDDTESMRAAAERYRGEPFDSAGGLFHPADVVLDIAGDGTRTDVSDPHYAGLMRLSREYLSTEVVAHECIHAAATIYRMDVLATIVLGNGCREREETFAYIAGHLISRVTNALHDAGVWS